MDDRGQGNWFPGIGCPRVGGRQRSQGNWFPGIGSPVAFGACSGDPKFSSHRSRLKTQKNKVKMFQIVHVDIVALSKLSRWHPRPSSHCWRCRNWGDGTLAGVSSDDGRVEIAEMAPSSPPRGCHLSNLEHGRVEIAEMAPSPTSPTCGTVEIAEMAPSSQGSNGELGGGASQFAVRRLPFLAGV